MTGMYPIPLRTDEKLRETIQQSVYRIRVGSGTANGFLCVYKRGITGEDDIFLLITKNRVISDISMSSLKLQIFEFLSLPNLMQFQVSQNVIEDAWTDQNVYSTVIEIKQCMAARMMHQGARFIEMGPPVVGNIVAVMGYQEGNQISCDCGVIEQIRFEWHIFHRISSKPGCCGAPLVNMEGKVVGIHQGICLNVWCEAVSLEFVLKQYFQQRKVLVKSATQGISYYDK